MLVLGLEKWTGSGLRGGAILTCVGNQVLVIVCHTSCRSLLPLPFSDSVLLPLLTLLACFSACVCEMSVLSFFLMLCCIFVAVLVFSSLRFLSSLFLCLFSLFPLPLSYFLLLFFVFFLNLFFLVFILSAFFFFTSFFISPFFHILYCFSNVLPFFLRTSCQSLSLSLVYISVVVFLLPSVFSSSFSLLLSYSLLVL